MNIIPKHRFWVSLISDIWDWQPQAEGLTDMERIMEMESVIVPTPTRDHTKELAHYLLYVVFSLYVFLMKTLLFSVGRGNRIQAGH